MAPQPVFPNEILIQITAQCLPSTPTLSSLRLVCRRFATIATPFLFHTLTYSTPGSIEWAVDRMGWLLDSGLLRHVRVLHISGAIIPRQSISPSFTVLREFLKAVMAQLDEVHINTVNGDDLKDIGAAVDELRPVKKLKALRIESDGPEWVLNSFSSAMLEFQRRSADESGVGREKFTLFPLLRELKLLLHLSFDAEAEMGKLLNGVKVLTYGCKYLSSLSVVGQQDFTRYVRRNGHVLQFGNGFDYATLTSLEVKLRVTSGSTKYVLGFLEPLVNLRRLTLSHFSLQPDSNDNNGEYGPDWSDVFDLLCSRGGLREYTFVGLQNNYNPETVGVEAKEVEKGKKLDEVLPGWRHGLELYSWIKAECDALDKLREVVRGRNGSGGMVEVGDVRMEELRL